MPLACIATAVVYFIVPPTYEDGEDLANQPRPIILSTNREDMGVSFTVPCSVWKVYRLGCKVSAVCKAELVGKRI